MARNLNKLSSLEIKDIRNYFGFDNEMAFIRKSINVPVTTKLEWLEEIHKSICRLPLRCRKQVMQELKHK